MKHLPLLTPFKMGHFELPHRVVMAPMTRNRAGEGNVPTDLNATYYAQRASAALIITEATQISPQGVGYPWTPGIHTSRQVTGWRKVTDAVHQIGGRVFLQLWHVGRHSHPSYHYGELPVAPSAIRPDGQIYTYEGMKDFVTPRALETEEIAGIVEDYRQAARNAQDAGFDGIEIHGANGYLPDQFLCDGTNQRTDKYGGSAQHRARFVLEVIEAVCNVWDCQKVGFKLSPSGIVNSMYNSEPVKTFDYLIDELNSYNLAYIHLMEPLIPVDDLPLYLRVVTPHYRRIFKGTIITNGGYDFEKGNRVIENGDADLVSYAQLYLANPDLPERFASNTPLNVPDRSTFYGGGRKGYTDYPFMKKFAYAT